MNMAANVKKADVRSTNRAYDCMREKAILPETLMGGTRAMRAAGKEYLPQEPAESAEAYKQRIARSFLFNAYEKAVNDLTGRLFKKGLKTEKIPPELEALCDDIDLTGRDLSRFSKDLFKDAWHSGITYLLVEFPPTVQPDGTAAPLSQADESAMGLRPYWIHITQKNLINWTSKVVNGVERLTRVQILEEVEEADGDWGSCSVEQVRVLRPGSWELWRQAQDGNKEWYMFSSGMTTLDFIPLIPIYLNRKGFMVGAPVMENLAELNLCHWQSSSDQRHILHVARVPFLFGAGFTDTTGKVEIGPNRLIKNSDPNSKLAYVEHTGKSIEAGNADLENLEKQMKICAMEPLMPKTGAATATARALDSVEAATALEEMGESFTDSLELTMQYTNAWLGGDVHADVGCIEIEVDFSLTLGDQADLDTLTKARAARDISREAYLSELKRRDLLSKEFDIEEDALLLDAEGPALGDLTQGGFGNNNNNDPNSQDQGNGDNKGGGEGN